MDATAVELVLGEEPDAVPRARRFTRQMLAVDNQHRLDDAELIVAELVTNALLYGGSPVTLRLSHEPGRLRIEVADSGHELPVRFRTVSEAMTGRGLGMVAALASAWGVEAQPQGGKLVWAEISDGAGHERRRMPDTSFEDLVEAWTEGDSDGPVFTVKLGAVPTELLLEAKAQIDNMVREFTLAGVGAAATGAEKLPPPIARLVETVVHGFVSARAQIKHQAAAAAQRGDAETELTLVLPLSAADAGAEYLDALDEADHFARSARLLTLETPPLHQVFRRWYVESLISQLRRLAEGGSAQPEVTFLQRLGEEVARLAPLQALAMRLTMLQKVTGELTGARDVDEIVTAVVANAIDVLGAHAARVYLLGDDGVLRSAAVGGSESELARQYDEVPADGELPGAVALRTGRPVVVRSLAELTERFPSLAGIYAEERSLLVAPLAIGGHRLGVLSLTFRGPSRLDEDVQLTFLTTLADVTAQALERAVASSAASQAGERLAFLAQASVLLSSTLDYRSVLEEVARLVVPRLADWCLIQLIDEQGSLQTVALSHVDPDRVSWAQEMADHYPPDMAADSGAPNVIRSGTSELYPEITDDMLVAAAVDAEHLRILREVGMSSALTVPLTGRSGTFGALTMIYADSGRRYGDSDVSFVEDLALRAALAVENATIFTEQSGRLAEVTRVAEAAQHAILAPLPERLGPAALAARYLSAAAEALVGGDLYEAVERPGAVRLLIGDVRGKGLDAVRAATIVLGEFRAAAAGLDDLATVARQIDRRVRRYLDDEDFVTALLAEILDDGSFSVVSCGHPPALLVSNGGLQPVPCTAALPLGLGADPEITTGRLAVGDRLFLYTDGIVEARDEERRFIELPSLVGPLVGGELGTVLDEILEGLLARVGGALSDDLALLVAEYRGR